MSEGFASHSTGVSSQGDVTSITPSFNTRLLVLTVT